MFGNIAGTSVVILYVVGLVILILLILLARAIRVIPEYERGVVFTLGKFRGVRKPGLTLIIPVIQILRRVDMRLATDGLGSRPPRISRRFPG